MAKKITTVTTTRVANPEPKIVQQTTTTRVIPEPKPRVVEQTKTVEKKGVFGGKKITTTRDTVIED